MQYGPRSQDYILLFPCIFLYYMQIYNNGYVSLARSGTTGGYTPRPFPFRGAPMIAPYWADVDTRATGAVYYRNSVSSSELGRVGRLISSTYRTSFRPTSLYIVTWYRVGAYYRSRSPVSVSCMFILQSCMHASLCSFMYVYYCKPHYS